MITEHTHLQSRLRKFMWALFTLFMWFLYAYQLAPLITLTSFPFEYQGLSLGISTSNSASEFKTLIIESATFLALLCSAFLVWAIVEKLRFKKKNRRSGGKPVSNQSIASHFDLDAAIITEMQSKKIVTVKFNDQGNMTQIHI